MQDKVIQSRMTARVGDVYAINSDGVNYYFQYVARDLTHLGGGHVLRVFKRSSKAGDVIDLEILVHR